MGDAYPEVRRNREMIEKTILAEENRFEAVLTEGLPRLEAEIAKVLGTQVEGRCPGDGRVPAVRHLRRAVRLHRGHGGDAGRDGRQGRRSTRRWKASATRRAPAARSAAEEGRGVRDRRRAISAALAGVGDQFEGYTTTRVSGVPVVALFDEQRQPVDALVGGSDAATSRSRRTPFYLEAGGQVSDTGRIVNEATGASATVEGLARIRTGPAARAPRPRRRPASCASATSSPRRSTPSVRNATRRNHTATHLLHAALREVLGTHVKQAGSLVAPDRLRFDFVHFQPVTREELDRIERIVNEQICRNTPVTTEVRSTQEAIAAGAMALFGEKYGDQVRVVSVPGFSLELCGGTHVQRDRRHRLLRRSSARAASRPACGASRR